MCIKDAHGVNALVARVPDTRQKNIPETPGSTLTFSALCATWLCMLFQMHEK